MPTSERDYFIVRFDKPHAIDMGTFGAGQFHNRPVLYSFKTKQGLPVFWVLPPDYFVNGWGGGTNIWQSLKLGSQQADLDEGQVPLPRGSTFFSIAAAHLTVSFGERRLTFGNPLPSVTTVSLRVTVPGQGVVSP